MSAPSSPAAVPLGPQDESFPVERDARGKASRAIPEPGRFLTVEDLAGLLGISARGARLVLERGDLPGFRLGRRWYLRREDLDHAIAEKVASQHRDRDAAARILRGLPARRAPRKP